MVTYFYDCYSILNKVYSEKAFLKQAILKTPIEEKNRSLTIKTCYGVLDKDIELSYYIKVLAPKSPKLVIRTILKIAMYAIKYLEKRGYAVTQNAVELTKKLGKGGTSGFVNAFLRKFIDFEFKLPTEKIENLSVKYSFPQFAVKKLINDYGEETAENIMSASFGKTALVFYNGDGEKYLNEHNVKYEVTPLKNVSLAENFVRNEDYDLGVYTFQSVGSAAICSLIDGCEDFLDCCAAPGGKSVNLSYKCKSVLSFDIHSHRVDLIKSYAERMKRDNITAICVDAKIYDEQYKERFDGVLCDVPCSGYGVVLDNPDIKLNREEKSLQEISIEQLAILNNASKYVKKGGYLYYSTCSIFFSENIEIVKKFLALNKNFKVEKVDCLVPHINVENTLQFLPNISFGGGFYFAKLKREEK